jgi:hypothetical protein
LILVYGTSITEYKNFVMSSLFDFEQKNHGKNSLLFFPSYISYFKKQIWISVQEKKHPASGISQIKGVRMIFSPI